MAIAGWPISSFPIAGGTSTDDSAPIPSYAAPEEHLYQMFMDYTATTGDFYEVDKSLIRDISYVDRVTPFLCPGKRTEGLARAFW